LTVLSLQIAATVHPERMRCDAERATLRFGRARINPVGGTFAA
jgi:hypothetical protein